MRQIAFFIIASCAFVLQVRAQNTDPHFNAGVGLSGWGIPIYLDYDWPIAQDINLGADLSYQSKTEKQNFSGNKYKWTHTIFGLGLRGTYYADRVLDIPEDFDLYGGLGLGWYIWDTKFKSNGNVDDISSGGGSGGLGLTAVIGGRYYLNNKVALNLELLGGNVLSSGRFGLSWRL